MNTTAAAETDKMIADQQMKQNMTKNPIQLSWEDITIRAKINEGKICGEKVITNKLIIDNVSGTVQPGQFLAIIGASGMFD